MVPGPCSVSWNVSLMISIALLWFSFSTENIDRTNCSWNWCHFGIAINFIIDFLAPKQRQNTIHWLLWKKKKDGICTQGIATEITDYFDTLWFSEHLEYQNQKLNVKYFYYRFLKKVVYRTLHFSDFTSQREFKPLGYHSMMRVLIPGLSCSDNKMIQLNATRMLFREKALRNFGYNISFIV